MIFFYYALQFFGKNDMVHDKSYFKNAEKNSVLYFVIN